MSNRPICPECNERGRAKNNRAKSGYARTCSVCKHTKAAQKKGMTLKEFYKHQKESAAKKAGMSLKDHARYKRRKAAAKRGMTPAEYSRSIKEATAAKLGMTPAEYDRYTTEMEADNLGITVSELYKKRRKRSAKNKGMTVAQYVNMNHPYRKYKKDYCENTDGRLGFECTTTILHHSQLHVDHNDGDPTNNTEENCVTYCSCCHAYKTFVISKDFLTPGRRTLTANET